MQMKMVTSLLSAALLLSGTNMMASQNGTQNGVLSNPTVRKALVGAGVVAAAGLTYKYAFADKDLDEKRRAELLEKANIDLTQAKAIEDALDETLFTQADVAGMHKAAGAMKKIGHRQLGMLKARAAARKATLKKIEHNFAELYAGEDALVQEAMQATNSKLAQSDKGQQRKIDRLQEALGVQPQVEAAEASPLNDVQAQGSQNRDNSGDEGKRPAAAQAAPKAANSAV